eukprot:g2802.t1
MKRFAQSQHTATELLKKRKVVDKEKILTCDEVKQNGDSILTIMNYNIDGLGKDLLVRTKACIDIIIQQNADIVTLQEVIEPTRDLLIHVLTNAGYENKSSSASKCSYFTMIFIKRKSNLKFVSSSRIPYRKSNSQMGRDILTAVITIDGTKVQIITSHLESTKSHSMTRCKQLKEIFDDYLFAKDVTYPVIFCGDTNLSYNNSVGMSDERIALGNGLKEIDDAYKASNAPTKFSSTWARNFGSRKIYCRFDRFYSNKIGIRVIGYPDGFNIVGKDDIQGVNDLESGYKTPSDHFGVVVKYAIKSNVWPTESVTAVIVSKKNDNPKRDKISKSKLTIKKIRAKRLNDALLEKKSSNDSDGTKLLGCSKDNNNKTGDNLVNMKHSNNSMKHKQFFDSNSTHFEYSNKKASTVCVDNEKTIPTVAGKNEEKNFWTCNACTFHNVNMFANVCLICQSLR